MEMTNMWAESVLFLLYLICYYFLLFALIVTSHLCCSLTLYYVVMFVGMLWLSSFILKKRGELNRLPEFIAVSVGYHHLGVLPWKMSQFSFIWYSASKRQTNCLVMASFHRVSAGVLWSLTYTVGHFCMVGLVDISDLTPFSCFTFLSFVSRNFFYKCMG